MRLRVIITVLVMSFISGATAPPLIIPPTANLTTVEIKWTAVPTSPDVGCAETIWLDQMSFSVAGTGRTVTVSDQQGSPVAVINAVALSANQMTVITFPSGGTRMDGGFTLSASGAGVSYQFRGRVKR